MVQGKSLQVTEHTHADSKITVDVGAHMHGTEDVPDSETALTHANIATGVKAILAIETAHTHSGDDVVVTVTSHKHDAKAAAAEDNTHEGTLGPVSVVTAHFHDSDGTAESLVSAHSSDDDGAVRDDW